MKILLNCHLPFQLAHGGTQVQIEQTKSGLEKIGIEAEYLRWWDESQTGDILHQFGTLPAEDIDLCGKKGWRIAMTVLLTQTCNRSARELFIRKILVRTLLDGPLPQKAKRRLQWHGYRRADRMIVGLDIERQIMRSLYGLPPERVSVVPLGLSEPFLKAGTASRSADHLICTGTIGPSKNSLQLAQYAREADVPMLFVGQPFDYSGDYWKQFSQLLAGSRLKHQPQVTNTSELIALFQQARGYVLMSRFENWSLAAHEAAACGLPMLLPDQPWARERFGDRASYFPKPGQGSPAEALRNFYHRCPQLPPPGIKLHSWVEVAEQLRGIYQEILDSPPPA